MKKHSKRLFPVAVLVLLLLFCFPLAACRDEEEEADPPTAEQLPAPENLHCDRVLLSWDAVEHAQGYYVRVGEGEAQLVERTSYEITALPAKETYRLWVSAKGDGETCADSDWAPYTYRLEEYPEEGYDANGLLYQLMEDKRGYEVSKGKSDLVGTIDIRDEMFGLPVLRVAENAFTPKEGEGETDPRTFEPLNAVTTAVHLPERLESIGSYAFARLICLEEVIFPESVTDLGKNGFMLCKRLGRVVFPKGLKEIPNGCFAYCSLEELNFPQGLERIGDSAFSGVHTSRRSQQARTWPNTQRFTEVIFPDSVQSIGRNAFATCDLLEYVRLPAGLTEQGIGIFTRCSSLKKVEIPEGVTSIASRMFYGCSALAEVLLPSTLTEIDDATFLTCKALQKIVLPKNLERLGAKAFYSSGLEELVLPKSLEQLESGAFDYCGLLAVVWYEGSFAEWQALDVPLEKGALPTGTGGKVIILSFYASEKPEAEGNYWRYVNGVPTAWEW